MLRCFGLFHYFNRTCKSRISCNFSFFSITMVIRYFHTNKERIRLVDEVEKLLQQGVSQRKACYELGIEPRSFWYWRHHRIQLLIGIPSVKTNCKGPSSFLDLHHKVLLEFIMDARGEGFPVSIKTTVDKAKSLDHDFASKSEVAQRSCVRCWVKSQGLCYHFATRVAQKNPKIMEQDAFYFMCMARELVFQLNRHKDYILSMDQMPV